MMTTPFAVIWLFQRFCPNIQRPADSSLSIGHQRTARYWFLRFRHRGAVQSGKVAHDLLVLAQRNLVVEVKVVALMTWRSPDGVDDLICRVNVYSSEGGPGFPKSHFAALEIWRLNSHALA